MNWLAIDLGAESGRAMLGSLEAGRLSLEELHRFPNTPVRLPNGLYWDALRQFHEIRCALTVCGRERKLHLEGIGVDTWGVDFALLAADGTLLDNPRHYRDARNRGMRNRLTELVTQEEVFRQTGVQFLDLNTLCQWLAMRDARAPSLSCASTLLFMPDLFGYWLSGVARAERTIASTSQFYNPVTRSWSLPLLRELGLDASILPEIVDSGAVLGPLLSEIQAASGLTTPVPVFATAGHDTASAVVAVPAQEEGWCYISSGTWSLLGAEIASPVLAPAAMEANFTNEVGAFGRIRFLKNIAGLWLLQECRRAWSLEGREFSYEELAAMAAAAPPAEARIDPNAFATPGDMPAQIARYCRDKGQRCPTDPAGLSRLILESLAASYSEHIGRLEALLGRSIRVVHIVGGGSRNRFLNQLTADFSGRTVIAGPTEATAAGNVLVQAIGCGRVANLEEARAIVARSFPLETFLPRG